MHIWIIWSNNLKSFVIGSIVVNLSVFHVEDQGSFPRHRAICAQVVTHSQPSKDAYAVQTQVKILSFRQPFFFTIDVWFELLHTYSVSNEDVWGTKSSETSMFCLLRFRTQFLHNSPHQADQILPSPHNAEV